MTGLSCTQASFIIPNKNDLLRKKKQAEFKLEKRSSRFYETIQFAKQGNSFLNLQPILSSQKQPQRWKN
jgi:hypothetical protein